MKNINKIIQQSSLVLLLTLTIVLPSSVLRAAIFEPGFEVETIATGLTLPGSMAFAPDGRIFIAEKGGAVRIIKDGVLLGAPLITLTDVNTFGDRGLLSITFDPNFAQNGYLYLSYTYENTPGTNFSGPKTGRIARVTVVGDSANEGSKVVILGTTGGNATTPSCEDFTIGTDCIPSDSMSHSVGGLRFGPDGYLYATLGDGANFDAVDSRALRAQNLDSLGGKLIRINSNGTAPTSNPFFDGNPNSNRSKVFAYGLRNAFRLNFHPITGALFLGDVGWSDWEEINLVTPGANYGWPCREGLSASTYNCSASSSTTDPVYVYGHDSNGAGAIVAGAFPSGAAYPVEYSNSLFIGDYAQNWIKRLILDGNNNLISVQDFMDNPDGPVDLTTGPDGNVYYISIYTGELHRITHTAGNRRPIPVISANPSNGLTPLNVNFSSGGSSDPDGDPMTYNWNFGDGQTSNVPNPSHTYTSNGNYVASLTLTDSFGSSASKSITISAGNQKPIPQITNPPSGLLYTANQVINLNGTATDPEDGALGNSAFNWQIILHHNTHIHVIQEFIGTSSPSFLAPDHGSTDVYVEVKLIVTDSGGLSDTRSANLYLNTGNNSGNLIINPSLETEGAQGTPSGWVKGGYGVNNAVFTYPVAGFEGTKGAQLDMSAVTDGDAKWFFSPVFVTPLEKYNFYNYYTSNTTSNQFAQFGFSDGTYQYAFLGILPATSTPTKVSRDITMPANVKTFTIFHGLNSSGTLTVDNYSLTLATSTPLPPPPPPVATSSIFFAGFETGTFSEWNSSVGSNFTLSGGTCRSGPDTNINAVKITGANTPHNQTLTKTISTAGFVNLNLSFCYKWDVLEAGDGVVIEYTADGTNWSLLKDINNSTVRHMMYAADDTEIATSNGVGEIPTPIPTTLSELASMSIAIPAGASDKSTFALRIREHMTDGDDYVWMDDFRIQGTSGTATSTPPPPPATTTNQILNPSLETVGTSGDPSNWFRGGWGTNNRIFTYPVSGLFDVTTGMLSPKAARVEITSYTDGDAKWYFADVPLNSSNQYEYSYSYRSNVGTNLIARYTKTNGSFQYISYGSRSPATTSDMRVAGGLIVPSDAVSVTFFHVLTSIGYLEIDNFTLNTVSTSTPSDTVFPVAFVSSPASGSTISGTTTIAVNATDNVGVSAVALFIDGLPVGVEDTTAPYSFAWDTRSVPNGPHIISAGARDTSGNFAAATSTISVTVSNSGSTTATSLIQNYSLETAGIGGDPANWFRGGWGTNTRTFTYPTVGSHGPKAVRVEVSSYSNGDAKWYFTDVPVTAGTAYTFSHSYRSSVPTNITARYTRSDGSVQYVGILNLPISNVWTTSAPQTIVIPSGVVSMTLFHALTSVGWLETDNFILTTGVAGGGAFTKGLVSLTFDDGWLSHYTNALPILNTAGKKGVFYIVSQETLLATPDERIQNPSLETTGTNGDPTNWFRGGWGTNNRVFTYPVAGIVGAKAARVEVTSYTNGDAKWYFGEATVIPNQNYILKNSYNSNVSTQALVRYTSTTGVTTYSFLATLPSTAGTWQNFERTITIPANTASLTLFHVLPGIGSLTVDNYSLKRVQVFVDPSQMLALQSSGHEVGAHTRTHSSLITMTPAQYQSEIAGSRTDILGMGALNVDSLAYPFGDYNSDIQTATANAGFMGARSVLRGYNTKTTDKFALKIQQLNRTTTLAEVEGWISQAALDKTWLILMFHQIDSDPNATLGVTPAFLQQIVTYLGTANVDVVTVKQGLGQMN